MGLKIIKAGILDTIQDAGRKGFQHWGINPGGAMDHYSMQMANILVGNDLSEAVIELHFPSSVFLFDQPALIACTGGNFCPSINGDEIPLNHPVIVGKNDVLHFQKPGEGARTYLAVRGGFAINKWLSSYSTNLKANAGGYHGRGLFRDDEIQFRKPLCDNASSSKARTHTLPWSINQDWKDPCSEKELLVLPGKESILLNETANQIFSQEQFVISQQADRMGYRLIGKGMPVIEMEEMISTAVSFGTIQLLPGGQLIVLMADHQTTGGYPRIGHVIMAHHSKLAQKKAGEPIRFVPCDLKRAESLFLDQQGYLLQLQNACILRLEVYLRNYDFT